jgi:hypothetical protein
LQEIKKNSLKLFSAWKEMQIKTYIKEKKRHEIENIDLKDGLGIRNE